MSAAANGPSRQRKPRTEPELSVPRLITPDNQTDGVVRITLGQVTADSFLTPIRSRIGRGFLVEKSSRDGSEGPYLVSLVGDKWTCDRKDEG
jgi:hypothetical protein